MEKLFVGLSNFELIECYYSLRKALGESHSLTLQVQEELFSRMEEQQQ